MFLIDGPPPFLPGMCLLTKHNEGKFIDLDQDFTWDHEGRMYLSVSAVRDMWALCKHLYENDEERVDELAERDERIHQLEREVEELEQVVQSVYVLKQKGFAQQRKPGRKPSTAKEPVTSGS